MLTLHRLQPDDPIDCPQIQRVNRAMRLDLWRESLGTPEEMGRALKTRPNLKFSWKPLRLPINELPHFGPRAKVWKEVDKP